MLTLAALLGAPSGAAGQEIPDSAIVTVIAQGLQTVWALAEAPDGRLFVTEHGGLVRTIVEGELAHEPWPELAVHEVLGDEAGLMGVAIDPDFASNGFVYLCYSMETAPRTVVNRVVRMRDSSGVGVEETVLLDSVLGGSYHDGYALAFGPDGLVYVSTGDAYDRSTPQDLSSAGGKILRIDRDGMSPSDNPFPDSPVWALGLRNPQGFGWDPESGLMFATDHGPRHERHQRGQRDYARWKLRLACGLHGAPSSGVPVNASRARCAAGRADLRGRRSLSRTQRKSDLRRTGRGVVDQGRAHGRLRSACAEDPAAAGL